jgi:sigma-B regulation protein RsbU (phosphoserine phosphatase)
LTDERKPAVPAEVLERENFRLKRAVEELATLNDLARAIGASLDTQEIMNTIIRRSLRAVNAEQGVITLVDEKPDPGMKTLIRTVQASSEREAFHLDQILLGWMLHNKKPLVMNKPDEDPRFRGVRWDASIHSLLCVPLLVKSALIGVLTVCNKKLEEDFSEGDMRLLAIIAAQSAQVIENARLYEEEKALLRMREEVRFATEIQLELLPKGAPEFTGFEVSGATIPARGVGGDYYDFIPVDEHHLAFCLGDVTGKGLPAALLMANLQATIRGQTMVSGRPSECMERSNELLHRSTDPVKFATLFYGILDSADGSLWYSSAGHDQPYLFSGSGEAQRLGTGGMMLGAIPGLPYQDEKVPLAPGDLLVVFSDGITEAMAESEEEVGEQFGEERLLPLLEQNRGEKAERLIQIVVEAVKKHAGKREQSDDMTLVVVRKT